MSERWHLGCDKCGHWRVAHVEREDVAAWFRVHPLPHVRSVPEDDGTEDRESICPCPCGTPYDAELVKSERARVRREALDRLEGCQSQNDPLGNTPARGNAYPTGRQALPTGVQGVRYIVKRYEAVRPDGTPAWRRVGPTFLSQEDAERFAGMLGAETVRVIRVVA